MSSLEQATSARHVPVMLDEVLRHLAVRDGGIYVDGTFGAGGYSRAILSAAQCRVFGIDRDPDAIRAGASLVAESGGRLKLLHGRFGDLAALLDAEGIGQVDGVVLDIGVSSMQIDDASRGFSFMRDGPLDMRMSQDGPSAADAVNTLAPAELGNIIAVLGEEKKARAIARAIAAERAKAPIATTSALVKVIERVTGPQRGVGRIHPATRTFQALRIHVNGELEQLAEALTGAEAKLRSEGRLVVVTFHSLEDRIVKRFFTERAGLLPHGSRHAPQLEAHNAPSFALPFKGHLEPGDAECGTNPRARSAKLRVGVRTSAPPWPANFKSLGVPQISGGRA
ncbi:MAG: 16S rRNA (cytosine(1402)-N(4))-methyltransferase RsmH [Rhizobiales bacterium]|nr:16S rRNA (cytosine(1402)-N(4))-methyltransferase RsmH [Hyphomicrobiales bacterium]